MKTFRDYLKEEVKIGALASGGIGIERDAVRDEINGILSGIGSQPCITPYGSLNRIRKALAYFSIFLPKKVYMEGRHGIEVWEIHQFGDKMGMTDQGEFIKSVPAKYYLFLHYHLIGSMYYLESKIVDDNELEERLSRAERMVAEEADASNRQGIAKAMAPKEPMHDEDDDGTVSTKKAVEVSMRRKDKKLSADSLDEAMTRKQKDMAVRRFMSHDPKAGESILAMGKKEREEKKSFASGKKEVNRLKEEEQIDEVSLGKLVRYKNERDKDVRVTGISASHSEDMAKGHKASGNEKKSKEFSDEGKWLRGKQDKMKAGIKLADKKMKGKARVNASMPKHPYMEETMEEGRMPPSVIAHKQKLASMSDKEFAEKHGHKSEKQLRDMGARHGYGFDKATKTGSDHYVKRAASKQIDEKAPPGAKYERMVKHIKAGYAKDGLTAKEKGIAFATAWKAKKKEQMDEAMGSVKKSHAYRKMKTKVNTIVRKGLGKKRETGTILVTNKGDPHAATGGGVRRIPKDKYDPSKHNMASE
jgi:hypothetical protein